MKIQFCGASTGVTGSCHLITTENHKVLLDCGQFQGGKAQEALNYEDFPFDPAEIDYVILRSLWQDPIADKTWIQGGHILY